MMLRRWGSPKGSRIPACPDFYEIYPTGPVFTPKMRKGGRDVQGEQGVERSRWGGVSPDTHPIRAAVRVANKPLAISPLIGASSWVAGDRSGGFAAQPASKFVTPIQAAEKRLAVGERPYGT